MYRNGLGFVCNKPPYGLWASAVDSEFGWREWCEGEGFKIESFNKSFEFELAENANILRVEHYSDIKDYASIVQVSIIPLYKIDYKRMMKDYDGLELINFGLNEVFYGWECESIIIWNPDVIIPIANKCANICNEDDSIPPKSFIDSINNRRSLLIKKFNETE